MSIPKRSRNRFEVDGSSGAPAEMNVRMLSKRPSSSGSDARCSKTIGISAAVDGGEERRDELGGVRELQRRELARAETGCQLTGSGEQLRAGDDVVVLDQRDSAGIGVDEVDKAWQHAF